MKIVKEAIAGTLESSDVMIRIIPAEEEKITINSSVKKLFGNEIRNTVKNVLSAFDVANVHVIVEDKGALDFILKARLKTALFRATDEKPQWNKVIQQ